MNSRVLHGVAMRVRALQIFVAERIARETGEFNANGLGIVWERHGEKLSRTDAFYVASNGASRNISAWLSLPFALVIIGRRLLSPADASKSRVKCEKYKYFLASYDRAE